MDIARGIFPDIPVVFNNTGLEYPEIQAFARSHENVDVVAPSIPFPRVITEYGYPIVSKEVSQAIYYARQKGDSKTSVDRRLQFMPPSCGKFSKIKWLPLVQQAPFRISHFCCDILKKGPLDKYAKEHGGLKPIVGTLAEESALRTQAWMKHGCNAFGAKKQISQPMSFWTEQDVLEYIVTKGLEIASVYGDIKRRKENGKYYCTGCQRTGCIFCAFGMYLDRGKTSFQRLADTHPKQYGYCIGGGQWIDNPDYDPTYDGTPNDIGWVYWNPPKLWVPSKEGLGMGAVFDMVNEIYGKSLFRYQGI